MLRARRFHERPFIQEVSEELAPRTALIPWLADVTEDAKAALFTGSRSGSSTPLLEASEAVVMRTIEVLGAGCGKCRTVAANAEQALKDAGVEGHVVKVQEIAEILAFEGVRTSGPGDRRPGESLWPGAQRERDQDAARLSMEGARTKEEDVCRRRLKMRCGPSMPQWP